MKSQLLERQWLADPKFKVGLGCTVSSRPGMGNLLRLCFRMG